MMTMIVISPSTRSSTKTTTRTTTSCYYSIYDPSSSSTRIRRRRVYICLHHHQGLLLLIIIWMTFLHQVAVIPSTNLLLMGSFLFVLHSALSSLAFIVPSPPSAATVRVKRSIVRIPCSFFCAEGGSAPCVVSSIRTMTTTTTTGRRRPTLSSSSLSLAVGQTPERGEEEKRSKPSYPAVPGFNKDDMIVVQDGILMPSWWGDDSSVSNLDQIQALHATIQQLQQQLPNLLSTALTIEKAQCLYTEMTRVVVSNTTRFELISSRNELIALSQGLVLLVTTSQQAQSFLEQATRRTPTTVPSTWGGAVGGISGSRSWGTNSKNNSKDNFISTRSNNDGISSPRVEFQLGLEPDLQHIRMKWVIEIPIGTDYGNINDKQVGSSTSSTIMNRLQGESLLELDPLSRKIDTHILLQVQWNDQEQNGESIAQFLSTLQQPLRSIQQSPIGRLLWSTSTTILDQLMERQVQEQPQQVAHVETTTSVLGNNDKTPTMIYVTEAWPRANIRTRVSNTSTISNQNQWIPLDEYCGIDKYGTQPPLPGSKYWDQYAISHKAIRVLCMQVIPLFSQSSRISDLVTWLDPQVTITLPDQSSLLRGNDEVANFYTSLTFWRRQSKLEWQLMSAQVLDWRPEHIRVLVNYTTRVASVISPESSSSRPLSSSVTSTNVESVALLSGSDIFHLTASERSDLPMQIVQVEQVTLSLGNSNRTGIFRRGQLLQPQDATWFLKTLASTIETGRRNDVSSVVLEWMSQFNRQSTSAGGSSPSSLSAKRVRWQYSDEVAVVVVRIMQSLHEDLTMLLDPTATHGDTTTATITPPSFRFMADQVELRGYFQEVLIRGRGNYQNTLGWIISFWKTSFDRGLIQYQTIPDIQVSLTSEGYVQCRVTIPNLQVTITPANWRGIVPVSPPPFQVRLDILSEYRIDPRNGQIVSHDLLESRINGQLTPGDVVARWISGRQQEQSQQQMMPLWSELVKRLFGGELIPDTKENR